MINKIISGGQTGVDQGALDFALETNIQSGGWCPKGRICETGQIPEKYPVTEVESDHYNLRTRLNVESADGTLLIIKDEYLDEGTRLTKELCEKMKKPLKIIDALHVGHNMDATKDEFRKWIKKNSIKTLNVAGNRESNSPGIHNQTIQILHTLLYNE